MESVFNMFLTCQQKENLFIFQHKINFIPFITNALLSQDIEVSTNSVLHVVKLIINLLQLRCFQLFSFQFPDLVKTIRLTEMFARIKNESDFLSKRRNEIHFGPIDIFFFPICYLHRTIFYESSKQAKRLVRVQSFLKGLVTFNSSKWLKFSKAVIHAILFFIPTRCLWVTFTRTTKGNKVLMTTCKEI